MVTIPAQFNGPEHSGNGGYVCGVLANELGAACAASTLRQPPPLDTPLTWEHQGDAVRLITAGGAVIGEATPGSFTRDVVPCPTLEEAEAGLAAFPGFDEHPYAHCFGCGTERAEGDGMRVFTGPVDDVRVAAPWTPHAALADATGRLDAPLSWAALDCAGGWAIDYNRHSILLGRMTATIERAPQAGEPLIVAAQVDGRDGRKLYASTALYTVEGERLGRAEQTWIELVG